MPRPTAAWQVAGKTSMARRSDHFLAGLSDYKQVFFVSHIQPDPDGLGSMVGLAHLVETCLGLPTQLTRDGQISRAENQAMVDLLDIDLIPIDEVSWDNDDAVVMVDSQPGTGRHTFDRHVPIYAVIDHHQTPGQLEGIPFIDIRSDVGATCSLATRYLMEQDIGIPERVATCLYYGIETELNAFPREADAIDDIALQFLYPLCDKDVLAKIRNTPLPQEYFECILQALQSSFLYDRLLISWVNELTQPEFTAQVVDFLVRHENVDWAVCAGIYQDRMLLSVRSNFMHARAGEILRQVCSKLGGRAGGHDRRAGGFIPLPSTSATAIEQIQSEFRRRLLKALGIEDCRGQRLVSRREILQNLQM